VSKSTHESWYIPARYPYGAPLLDMMLTMKIQLSAKLNRKQLEVIFIGNV